MSDTIREIDAFLAERGALLKIEERDWIAKIRAHVMADELERKRLQAEIMLAANHDGKPLFDEAKARHVLDLGPDWRIAPQRARQRARLMPPVRICGEKWKGDESVICHRKPNHGGEHCPIEDGACGVDHG